MPATVTGNEKRPRPYLLALGRRIRQLRLARNYNLKGLAETVGVAPCTVSSWELGHRAISVDRLVALAAALGVSPGQLLDGGGEEQFGAAAGATGDDAPARR